jgi:ubiquitin carboxyl-terminal hydrolase 2/21
VATVFASLVNDVMSLSSDKVVAPTQFKKQLEKWAPQFAGYRQQDSQEFLRFTLDGLHEDLNRIKERTKWSYKDADIDSLPQVFRLN